MDVSKVEVLQRAVGHSEAAQPGVEATQVLLEEGGCQLQLFSASTYTYSIMRLQE